MTQKALIALSAALTAFLLALVVGVASSQSPRPEATAIESAAASPPAEATPSPSPAPSASNAERPISAAQATALALRAAHGVYPKRQAELVDFQGAVAYEVTLDRGTVYVDAGSGQVLHNGAAYRDPRRGQGLRGRDGASPRLRVGEREGEDGNHETEHEQRLEEDDD